MQPKPSSDTCSPSPKALSFIGYPPADVYKRQRLSLIFRDALVLRMGGAAMLGGAPEEAQALCALPKRRLAALPGLAEEFKTKADRNANMALLVTDFCAKLREAAGAA